MRPQSKRSPLAIFTILFLLAMLSLSAIVVSAANTAAPPSRPSTAGDWPMYGHDVSRTNYNPDETTISAANVAQLVSRWQVNIQTNGTPSSSGPVVANGKVYVGSSVASGNNFFALDATTGVQAWAANLGYYNTCFNVGIGSTAAISGSTVVIGGGDQPSVAYYGLDANTGTQQWRVPINAGASAFSWASPLISPGGRTYFGVSSRCDNPSVRGEVRGLDYTTGLNPASAYFVNSGQAGGGVWNSPALSPDGTILVAATGEDYSCTPNCNLVRSMVTMDPSTMAVLQSNKQGSDNTDQDWGSTPLIFHDSQNRVLVGAHLKSVGGGSPPDFFTYVISDVNSGPLWSRNTSLSTGMMDAYDPTIGNGGTLFIFGGSNYLYAVDPATGLDSLWAPISVGATSHSNMALANGLIFLNLGSAGLQIRSEATGALLRTIVPALSGGVYSGVSVSHGFIYFLSGQYLNAWSLPEGGTPTPGTPTATSVPSSTSTTAPTSTHTAVPTSTSTATNTATHTTTAVPTTTHTSVPSTSTSTSVPTNTSVATSTRTSTAIATLTNTDTPLPTQTPGGPTATTVPSDTSTATAVATDTAVPTESTATATATVCTLSFADVPTGSTFYQYIQCMACAGVINGYPCGGAGEPCDANNNPYFRPGTNVTRGQFAKIASNAAGFEDPAGVQQYQDVVPGSTFYDFIWRLSNRNFVTGYPCGGAGEPCVGPDNLPYFRPNANITRGQISKIDSNTAGFNDAPGAQQYEDIVPGSTFYDFIWRLSSRGIVTGYPCGGVGEPCVGPGNLPYFRFNASATRGQASKIVSTTFFPACSTQ